MIRSDIKRLPGAHPHPIIINPHNSISKEPNRTCEERYRKNCCLHNSTSQRNRLKGTNPSRRDFSADSRTCSTSSGNG